LSAKAVKETVLLSITAEVAKAYFQCGHGTQIWRLHKEFSKFAKEPATYIDAGSKTAIAQNWTV
jgi:hypothetical protein